MYDNRIRPAGMNGTDTATTIVVNLFIRSFAKIDDVKMVRYEYKYFPNYLKLHCLTYHKIISGI